MGERQKAESVCLMPESLRILAAGRQGKQIAKIDVLCKLAFRKLMT